jgi:hypothetical protein
MRRILRKVAHGEEDSIGDVTSLADPTELLKQQTKLKGT